MPNTLLVKKPQAPIAYAVLLLLVHWFASCGPKALNNEEVIDKYGPEVINYFYETAFHRDKDEGRKSEETYRWEEDIRVSLHGDLLMDDSLFLQEALSDINSLDIPVSVYLVSDPKKSNVQLFFGKANAVADSLKIDSVTAAGIGIVEKSSVASKRARIGIINDAKIYTQTNKASASLLRKTTILEEMVQTLGVFGDSYTYYKSRFFEGANSVNGLSELDKKTLKFLYDERVFRNHKISRKDFEKRFSEVLYDRIDAEKFRGLADEYGLGRLALDSLGKMVFRPDTKDTFIKFPRTAFLKLSGDSVKVDAEFCRALAPQLNSITPYFQLELAEKSTMWNELPSITIHYENRESNNKHLLLQQVGVNENKMMFTYLIKGDIWLKFNDPEKRFIPFVNEKATYTIFETLGLKIKEEGLLVSNSLDSLEISEKYRNYFRFLYDPRFPSGISKVEFEELVKEIN